MKKPPAKIPAKAPAPAKAHDPDLDIVSALAKIAAAHDLAEVEIERGGLRVRVARGMRQQTATYVAAPAPQAAPAAAPPAAKAGFEASASPVEAVGTVKSPMVGTAYLRASPESKPFIEVGSKVKEGDKVLLVEAMKTFNDIVAPHSGTVTEIFVSDGTPVEYGQPLLVIA